MNNNQVLIQVHKPNDRTKQDIVVVRWQNHIGKDGLNCRILKGLPIRRGEDSTEFFFKSASTTTAAISRKTIFALKFESVDDADEFEMWWYMLSGQITEWKKGKEAVKADSLIARSPQFLQTIVDVSVDVEFFSTKHRRSKECKRKNTEMSLRSPRAQTASFFSFGSPESTKSPPTKRIKTKETKTNEFVRVTESSTKISSEEPSHDAESFEDHVKKSVASDESPSSGKSLSSDDGDESSEFDDTYVVVRDAGPAAQSQELFNFLCDE
jgi:hypothetical protein